MDKISVEKGACTEATGQPGFVCDFRLGIDRNGRLDHGPWAKGRFFESSGGWQFEESP